MMCTANIIVSLYCQSFNVDKYKCTLFDMRHRLIIIIIFFFKKGYKVRGTAGK